MAMPLPFRLHRYSDIFNAEIKFLLNVDFFMIKLHIEMSHKNISSRIYPLIKSAAAAAVLPVFFIYVMVAKPDYRIMNTAAHVVVPVGRAVGDLITWPLRATGRGIRNIAELTTVRAENRELRAELDAMRMRGTECEIAILENQKLAREIDIVKTNPRAAVAADVVHNNSAMHHNTYFISKGAASGIEPGMIVVTFDGHMAGIVVDAAPHYARVRALNDADTNIAVRVVGSEVYGFMHGAGTARPVMEFFSDPEFQPTPGLRLVTSNIGGILPDGIPVGKLHDSATVDIVPPGRLSRVMVLQFDGAGVYK